MPPRARITVTGHASRRVTPDVAVWSAATEAKGDTQRAAFTSCAAALTSLLDAVRAEASSDAEVSAGGVYVSPQWDERGRTQIGFVAGASVTIRGSLEEAGRLGQIALAAGAIRLDGPTFAVANVAAIRDALLADAVVAARRTADLMAAAADRTVGAAVRITDQSDAVGGTPPMYARAVSMEMNADTPPLEPESQEITAQAVVVFELLA